MIRALDQLASASVNCKQKKISHTKITTNLIPYMLLHTLEKHKISNPFSSYLFSDSKEKSDIYYRLKATGEKY